MLQMTTADNRDGEYKNSIYFSVHGDNDLTEQFYLVAILLKKATE
jgi:hypothetical protein